MAGNPVPVVFVHGWSVTHTDTYGGLPRRLAAEAAAAGLDIQTEEIHLGQYISFHDEVRVPDIARAFDQAVAERLGPALAGGRRFVAITHSTGGPVIREWWHRYHLRREGGGRCPMSHLVMLAPANFGSALAQLGKSRLSRLKTWFGGVEPGQGVLDWLELGSTPAWALNREWIEEEADAIAAAGVFPFVLTGQSIDRSLYDVLNTYTGEAGSDGVVRVAAAHLQGRYLRLAQQAPEPDPDGLFQAPALAIDKFREAPESALRVVAGKSHSGSDMGIMRSVHRGGHDPGSEATVQAILECLQVGSRTQYLALCRRFAEATRRVQEEERLERVERLLGVRYFLHDRHSMVIFKVRDDRGFPVHDYDLVLTGGPHSDPNCLPAGFLPDVQRNLLSPETLSFYFNYDLMVGAPAVVDGARVVREARPGIARVGLRLRPRPQAGFVHYLPCELPASAELLEKMLAPNATTLVDIRLRRVVHSNVFRAEPLEEAEDTSFRSQRPSGRLVR